MNRLTTDMMVSAALRIAETKGIFAAIVRKGDTQAGAVFVEIEKALDVCCLLARQVNFDGGYEWVCVSGEDWVTAQEVSQKLAREIERDADCWVVCVQDRAGRNIFELAG